MSAWWIVVTWKAPCCGPLTGCRAEYAYIEDVAVGMGCEKRLESGPGVALRLDGKVIFRAHPKRDHLALGLPDRMRSDVQALTLVLRAQKSFA